MGAHHGNENGHIGPASNNSSSCFLISNNSWGLHLYIAFYIGLAPSTRGILYMSPSFQLGGACMGNVPGNTSWYLHNTVCSNALFFSSTLTKYGIAPSGRSFSLYNISYKNNTGLPDVFIYLLYIMWELLIVPSGHLYHIRIILVNRLFKICVMCTELVTLIINPMYSICGALRRRNKFCSCLLSVVIYSNTYAYT